MRIARTSGKVAYILVGGFIAIVVTFAGAFLLPRLAELILGTAVQLVFFLVAVRSFRGGYEPVQPPRPWWRMTARPMAGFILGVLFALDTAYRVLDSISGHSYVLATSLTAGIEGILLTAFYIGSSIRLLRIADRERREDWTQRTGLGADVPS